MGAQLLQQLGVLAMLVLLDKYLWHNCARLPTQSLERNKARMRGPQLTATLAFATLLFIATRTVTVEGRCPNDCNQNGFCNSNSQCVCYEGFKGNDCSKRKCPTGNAWVGYPTSADNVHTQKIECSGAGSCDTKTGQCKCHPAFTGIACHRMACNKDCNGHGTCISMREAASTQNDVTLFRTTTYSLWDADNIYGCICDDGFTGYDCSQRTCIRGDDPLTTGQVDEVQILDCLAASGTFKLKFRDEVTAAINYNSDASALKAALETLSTIGTVTVAINAGTTVCDADGAASTITFNSEHGNLPTLSIVDSTLNSGSSITVKVDGASSSYSGTSVTGTKESDVCNGRGSCSTTTGECACFTGFSSSNGLGTNTQGLAGDCGYTTGVSTCAGVTVCSSRGSCSGSSQYKCTCAAGYTDAQCSTRTCPYGHAWWDEATGADTAHALAECSNRGICDRATGACVCQAGFSGDACQRLDCPIALTNSLQCAGHGTCHSLRNLATLKMTAGVLDASSYGSTPPAGALWDADKIYGCHCDKGRFSGNYIDFSGHDCSIVQCPTGDDPISTGQLNEKQTVVCTADGGTFTLGFRGQTTEPIAHNAPAMGSVSSLSGTFTVTFHSATVTSSVDHSATLSAGDVLELHNAADTDVRNFTISSISTTTIVMTERVGFASATTYTGRKVIKSVQVMLEALTTIRTVTVTFLASGTTACSASGQSIEIEFRSEFGNLPMLVMGSSSLTITSGSVALTVSETQGGTKEDSDCSLRGVCNDLTGACTCSPGYTSSNGYGRVGLRADCGAPQSFATVSIPSS